jgi:predicted enzyme related to lactoylglutathione lyase
MKKKEDPNQRPVNYFGVDSVDASVEKIKKAGGMIFVEKQEVPQMGWMAAGTDPEGNPIAVWQAMEGAAERRQEMTATARQ